MSWRTAALKPLMVVAGLVVGALAAELLARLVEPPVGGDMLLPIASLGQPDGMYSPHPTLRSAPTPGFEGVVRSVGLEVPVRFNQVGCRGPEPGPRSERWIAVGDSFTIALQVPWEASFPALLAERLDSEVLNCGVDGYSTWQARERYRLVDDVAPSSGVLLMFFLGNDLDDNARTAAGQVPERAGASPPEPRRAGPVERWLIAHSYLYGYGHLAWARFGLRAADAEERQRLADELGIFVDAGHERLQRQISDTRLALTSLRDEAEQRGDRLVVAVAPPVFAVDPARAEPTLALVGLEGADVDAPRRAVLELLDREGIQACDLSPALAASVAAGDAPYLLLDGHWSELGHRVVAEALATCLDDSGLFGVP